jgi:YVTN family beta-propeller protein
MKKNLPTRRSILAGATASTVLMSTGCVNQRSGLNPLLATADMVFRLFIAQHLDTYALHFLPTLVATVIPLLLTNRAYGVLALTIAATILKRNAATPDPVRIYMTLDDNTMVMLNPENGAVLARIPLGQQPTLIAASPNGDFLAISNALSHTVSIVNTADNRVSKTIPLEAGSSPYGVAVNGEGTHVYVVNEAKNSISVLDVAAGQISATINVPGSPSKIAMSPDYSLLWAPAANGTIYVIDTLSNTVSTTITGIERPVAVAFNPTGTKAYVTSAPTGRAGAVAVVDTATYAVLTRIPVGTNPYSIVLSAGGTRAFVSNFDSNNVSVIDTTTDQVATTLTTGKSPIEVAVI